MNFYKEVNYSDIKEPKELLDILNNYKVLVIKNYKNTDKVDDYLQNFVKSIGKIIGAGEDLHTGNPTENTLIEISYDPAEQMKYRTSKNAQPLHTDTSYTEFEDVPEFEENIKFLICLKKAPMGGATTFIDSKKLVSLMEYDERADLIDKLLTIPVGHKKGNREKVTEILKVDDGDWKLSWNYPPAKRYPNTKEADELVDEFKQFLNDRIENSGMLDSIILEDNDVVFWRDSYLLHGRNSYFASKKGERTLLKGSLILNKYE